MMVDIVFEFPRPTMPNIVYIGGFQCKLARPLAAESEEFVQGCEEHELIVMSLGALVDSLSEQIRMEIAEALLKYPRRLFGDMMGNPSHKLLTEWIPQNDLLRHPNTRVFISHGGTNGIYHGVPVISMPLIFDQFDNVVRLVSQSVAKVLKISTMHSTDLLQALNEVINDTLFRDNMKKLSALHRDQPGSPMK
ncbi:UDP-glucuronosyltransferase 2B17-like [Mobula hypostoma]|uniref:UDP-glucuronosyltransferase 2B17-like n=1 Tax=Mobula hypostoma TaxID=723540 RepID=UPI002FC3C1DD